jgi:hypothetical protein
MSAVELGWNSVVIVALGLLVFAYRNRTTLSPDALIGAVLAGYVIWQFGGWQWVVAPLILFATYTQVVGRPQLETSRPFHADVLLAIVAPGVILVTAYAVLDASNLYTPYVTLWAANLAVIGALHNWLADRAASTLRVMTINSARSLIVLVPALWIAGERELVGVLAGLCSVLFALVLISASREKLVAGLTQPASWARVALSVCLGTLASFMLFWIGQEQLK